MVIGMKAKKMYEHNALGYWSGLALYLTKVRSSRARCPATALIINMHGIAILFSLLCTAIVLQVTTSISLYCANIPLIK